MEAIVEVNAENIADEHICCAIGNDATNRARADEKKEWMRCRFASGHRFLKADLRGKVFVEFEPAESALAPVIAPGFQLIQCLWASGRYKGQGYGRALVEACERETQGSAGIAMIASEKKRPFMTEGRFLTAMGFVKVDEAAPHFVLYSKPFRPDAPQPRFTDASRSATIPGAKGFDIFYSGGCPYNGDYANRLAEAARVRGHRVDLHEITTREEALELPVAWGLFSLFYDGKLVTQEIYSDKKLQTFMDGLA